MSERPDVPMDDCDLSIMEGLARVHGRIDPPPADLDERVMFAIDVEDVDVEVARLGVAELAGAGARGDERTRTTTFEAASRTVMITVVDTSGSTVRVDGWLAPAAALLVELRSRDEVLGATADVAGRFVFDRVAHGLYQLSVYAAGAPRVVTPAIQL